MDWLVEVYDKSRKRIAILENAYNVGYEKEINRLTTAEFTLKIDDEKNKYCSPFNYIKLYENGEYIDMFRIMPMELTKTATTREITYRCEHVLGRLLDTCLFQYHEIGGVGTNTTAIINYILGRQSDWRLGRCDFSRQFQYSWENETLLSALFSIPNPFEEEFLFTWDTTVYPWVVNLIKPTTIVKAYLRYERNMKGIKKREDGAVVCTRLYALGYGEGVNQLGITGINPTKKPYIDADTIGTYGVIEKIWTDLRYQLEENLYYAAKSKLEKLKQPKITYEIEAAELWGLTGIPIDKFDCGDVVRVIDDDIGVDVTTRIIKKSKREIEKDYISAVIEVSSDSGESSSGLAGLYERAKINETYAQGATNINNYNYYGNCDTRYPAKIRFRIPEEAVHINKVELSFQTDAFRSYSKANKSAPATSSGASSSTTSGASSSTSTGASSSTTSGASSSTSTGASSSTTSGASSSTSTGASSSTSSGASSQQTTSNGQENVVINTVRVYPNGQPVLATTRSLSGENEHNHTAPDHGHAVEISGHSHSMEHNHNIAHTHGINHTHDIHHTHNIEHNHDTAHTHGINHTHNIGHTHQIAAHNHEIEYGIYEGPTASKFVVTVDGENTTMTAAGDGFNIVPYLSKDGGGKIIRGWHEVLINPDNLCMINADVMVQVFVNSRGGGNY